MRRVALSAAVAMSAACWLPAAAAYQDAHPGYSDPIDEQNFLVNNINQIEESRYWSSTTIVTTYGDSDGWYDHVASPIVNGSNTAADTAMYSSVATRLGSLQYRCGYGPRLPLPVISPRTTGEPISFFRQPGPGGYNSKHRSPLGKLAFEEDGFVA